MPPTLRLLMPSAGRKVALMRALERHFKVYPGGLPPQGGAACCLAGRGRYVELPRSDSPAFRKALLDAIRRIRIDVVLPVRNEDMIPLWEMRDEILETGAQLVLSPPETVAHCLDKMALFKKLSRHHLPTPYTTTVERWRDEVPEDGFPLFVKDRFGSGSRLAQRVNTPEELGAIAIHHEPHKLIVQPFLKGQEYTVDMFFCWHTGDLVQAVLRKRLSVMNGQMDSGVVCDPLPGDSYKKVMGIGHFMPFTGPVNVQFIHVEDMCYITDINPRFSGGIGLTIASGADFPAYLVNLVRGEAIQVTPSRVGATATSYADYVYG